MPDTDEYVILAKNLGISDIRLDEINELWVNEENEDNPNIAKAYRASLTDAEREYLEYRDKQFYKILCWLEED